MAAGRPGSNFLRWLTIGAVVAGASTAWALAFPDDAAPATSGTTTNVSSAVTSLIASPVGGHASTVVGPSCVSASWCLVAGASTGGARLFAETTVGPTLADGTLPMVAGAQSASLTSVSCPDTTWCVAVGNVSSPSGQPPFAETYSDGSWKVTSVGKSVDELDGVSCPVSGSCFAVGGDVVETLATGTWTETDLSIAFTLHAVSCASAHYCTAVGGNTAALGSGTIGSATYTSGTWSTQHPNEYGVLQSVSCPVAGECTAVGDGYTTDQGVTNQYAYQLVGGAWKPISLPVPPNYLNDSRLTSVSCSSASQCVAVGGYLGDTRTRLGLVQVLDNGAGWATTVQTAQTLVGVDCPIEAACQAIGRGVGTPPPEIAVALTIGGRGYLEGAADGGIFTFGSAAFWGSTGGMVLDAPIVGMASTPDGGGYWLVASDGGVFSFGDASFYGSLGGVKLDAPIVGMAATPDGRGYWLVASDGGVFTFGDAPFLGSLAGQRLTAPVVGISASVATGQLAYWLVAADGGVFTCGHAAYLGSMGGQHLSAPIVGMASTPTSRGYWLVGADGGVFAFGEANYYGSMGGTRLDAPIVGMASTTDGGGYRLFAADGGAFSFGDATFSGSMGGQPLDAPVVVGASTS